MIFRREALKILTEEIPKGRIVFVTGGSGFYIQALEKGMFPVQPVPKKIVDELNRQRQTKGLLYLYERLCEKDPLAAEAISLKDCYRVIRALAVIENEGRLFSEIKKENLVKKLPWPYNKNWLKDSKGGFKEKSYSSSGSHAEERSCRGDRGFCKKRVFFFGGRFRVWDTGNAFCI